eukprot:scaffold73310_cov31-Tisochrysis_lutea.AAC.5
MARLWSSSSDKFLSNCNVKRRQSYGRSHNRCTVCCMTGRRSGRSSSSSSLSFSLDVCVETFAVG